METLIDWAFKLFLFLIIFTAVNYFVSKDNTDPKGFWKRSGLSLYTDELTGCQYIKAGIFGNLVKRVDKYGHHICANRD